MRKIVISLLLFFLIVILSGCFGPTIENTNNSNQDINQNKNTNIGDSVNVNKPVVQKFYPETSKIEVNRSNASSDPDDGFVITQELEVKIYLVDKYNPGTCYGKPVSTPQSAIIGMIDRNPGLSEFIRAKYGFTSDLEVYNKIKQLNGIQLDEQAGGKYIYNFVDGQCCILKAYQGEVTIIGKTISDQITQQETKQNPC